MKTPSRRLHSRSVSTLFACLLLAGGHWVRGQADLIRDNTAAALSTGGAWLSNGVGSPGTVSLAAVGIWSNNVTTLANLSNALGGTVNWGGIRILSTLAPVTIPADTFLLRTRSQGITVEGNGLTLNCPLNANAAQTWNIAPGRLLTLQGIVTNNRSVSLNGTLLLDALMIMRSNATTFFMTNAATTATNSPSSIISTTNGTAQYILGGLAITTNTHVQSVGSMVLKRAAAGTIFAMANATNTSASYFLSGSTMVDLRPDPDQIVAQRAFLANDSNSVALLSLSNSSQFFADIMSQAMDTNTTSTVNIAGTSMLQARIFTNGFRGLGTINLTNSAQMFVSNNLALAGLRVAAPTDNHGIGSGIVNLNGSSLLAVGSLTRGGGFPTNTAAINFLGGTLRALATTAAFSAANVQLNVGSTFPAYFDIDTNSVINGTPFLHVSGVIPDAGLVKLGSGLLTQRGVSTYNGPTIVSNGTLMFDTTTMLSRGSITLVDNTTLAFRRLTNNPTVTNSALTAGSGTALNFDLITNGNPIAPLLIATNLTVSGPLTINITNAFSLSTGLFTVIDYVSATGTNNITLGILPPGVVANLIYDSVNTRIDLNITETPRLLVWNGNVDGSWIVGGPTNWFNAVANDGDVFKQGDTIGFDDSATGTRTITLNTNAIINVDFSPLILSNSSGDYSITGTGSYSGPFEFQKHGTSALTLGVASNDYTGNTIITGGLFKLAANEKIPHGAGRGNVQLDGGTTLDLNGNWEAINGFDGAGNVDNTAPGSATFIFGTNSVSGTNVADIAGVLTTNVGVHTGTIANSGGGALTVWKAGTRTNILTGANTHTGGTVIGGGVLLLANQAPLGANNNPIIFAGGTLTITNGAIVNTAPLTFRGNSTLQLTNNSTALFSGAVVPTNGTGFNLVVNGGGSVGFTGSAGQFATFTIDRGAAGFTNVNFTNSAFLSVGRAALNVATLNLDASTILSTNTDFNVADSSSSTGTLFITNNSVLDVLNLWVAKSATTTGAVFQTSGRVTNRFAGGTSVRIGGNALADTGTQGDYVLLGGRIDLVKALQVGAFGTGRMTIDGGEANLWSNSISIGLISNSVGTVLVSSGSLNNRSNGNIIVGNGGNGTLNITNTGLVTAVGNVTIGNSNTGVGILNLGTGGRLRALRVIDGAGTNTLNFLGGTLEANANVANFISGLTNCVVSSLGGTIDTGVFTATAQQAFSGSGVLSKVGTGNLTLTASNHTHNGATEISAGRLFITSSYRGVSPVSLLNAGFGARITNAAGVPSEINSVSTDNGGLNNFNFDFGVFGNPLNAVLHVTNLTINASSVAMNVTGANIVASATPIVLLDYDTVGGTTGTNNIVLGTLPPGVNGHLEYNVGNTSVDLIIDSVDPTVWDGTVNNIWDIDATQNWLIGGGPANYVDLVNVVFNDTATGVGGTSITIASNVTPGTVLFDNSGLPYTVSGPGRITGVTTLTKANNGVATLSVSNDFTGQTTVSGGTLRLGTNDVVPHGTGRSNLIVSASGTLDLNGFNETLNGLTGSGTINNAGASNSSLTIGLAATASTFTGSLQNSGSPLTLFKNTTSTNTLGGASSYGGGTYLLAGRLNVGNNTALGTGPLTVAAAATLGASANVSFTNIVLATNTGTGTIDTTGGNITLGGPVFWTGPELAKTGTGTLTFAPAAVTTLSNGSEFGVFGGSLVIDGAAINIDNDSFRLRAGTNTGSTTTVTATLQNNGSITIGDLGPFVLGSTADTNSIPPTRTNIFNLVSGTITVSNAGVFLGNGSGNVAILNQTAGLVTSSFFSNNNGLILCNTTNSDGIYNLDGGALEVSRIRKVTVTNTCVARFVFNGGTLRALNNLSAATFMQGLDEALVSSGGGTIDTGTNNLTILQNLLENPASTGGGLTKIGASNLTLTGTNTYTGNTTITNGRVVIGPAYSGLSPFVVNGGAGLGIAVANTNDIPTLDTATFNAGSSINFTLGALAVPTNIFSRITNLNFTGATVVNLSGTAVTSTNVTLVSFDSATGTNNLTLGSLPTGVTGELVYNPNSIDLVINVVGLRWTGVGSTLWEVAGLTNNWQDTANTPTNYNNNDFVRFDDSATFFTSTLATNVAPANVVVSNVANAYLIDGSNGIIGATRLTKQGAGTLTLASLTNAYNGGTWVEAGVLKNGTNEVIPALTTNLSITGAGVYDLNGFVETIRHLEGNGTVDNSAAAPGTLVLGVANNPGTFNGVIQDTGADLVVVKTNTGTNMFSGNSTWNGGMTIRNGQISAGHNNAFGTGLLTIIGGTVGSAGGPRTLTNSISTFTNRVDINFRADGGDLTLTGPLDGNADVNKVGTNTLIIGPANWNLHDGELAPRGGTTIISGSTIVSSNGFRVYPTTNFPNVDVYFTNNATMNLRLGGAGGNFIIGRNDDTNNVVQSSSFTMDSGLLSVGGGMSLAGNIGNVATMTQNGGTATLFPATNGGNLAFCNGTNSSGTYFLNGGSLIVPSVVKGNTTNTFARFVFGGGTLVALNSSNALSFMAGLDQAHVQAPGAKIDTAGFNMTIAQSLLQDGASPGGGLVKLGAGTLFLNGINTYTGTTTVSNGMLAGVGTIAGPVNVTAGGLISAGNSIGTLTINNSLTVVGGATMEINKTGAILTSDKIVGVTTLNYGGALNIITNGNPLVLGDSFDLFDAASPVGTFASLPTLGGGLAWSFNPTTGVLTVVADFAPNVQITDFIVVGGTNLNLVGSGGPPNGTNFVRTTNDMNIPLASWTIIMTNLFDGSGNFNFVITNAITTETNRFYRVVLP